MTLEIENVSWLKGRAGAVGESVSEVLDQIVRAAREGTPTGPARSVVGTIDIDSSDPLLERADAAVLGAFEASLGRPLVVHEGRTPYRSSKNKARTRRG